MRVDFAWPTGVRPVVLAIALTAACVGNAAAQSVPVLGGAESFAVLARTTVGNMGESAIGGDVGVGPGGTIDGLTLTMLAAGGALHEGDAVAALRTEGLRGVKVRADGPFVTALVPTKVDPLRVSDVVEGVAGVSAVILRPRVRRAEVAHGERASRDVRQVQERQALAPLHRGAEVVEGMRLGDPEPAQPGAAQSGEMATAREGGAEVTGEGATLREVLQKLDADYPGIGARILDDQGKIRRFVNVYVGEEDVRFADGLDTAIPDGALISIIPAVAGG